MNFDKDLPDELQGDCGHTRAPDDRAELDRAEKLALLGQSLAKQCGEWVSGRKESGIEAVWAACEDAYQGIDKANQHEFAGAKWMKSATLDGPLTKDRDRTDATKSTAYVRLTTRYVDMAAAKIAEIALSIDGKAFKAKPTPVPELVSKKGSTKPAIDPKTNLPLMAPGEDGQPKPLTEDDIVKMIESQANDAAEKAEKRMWDWMVESKHQKHMRKLLHDAPRIGVGVLKGPFPGSTTSKAIQKVGGGIKLTMVNKSAPAEKWIDPWNFFPDPSCGEDIHSGDGIFERDFISTATLKGLKRQRDSAGVPIYLGDQIDKVLKEGPGKCHDQANSPNKPKHTTSFEIWYYTGVISRKDMELTQAIGVDELPDELDEISAVVTMINDTVIRATPNPLESGKFGYNAMPWSRRAGSWAGVGVAEQIATPQKVINAAMRELLNNAGYSSGPQIIIDVESLVPSDGNDKLITPRKVWMKSASATTDDVRKMFTAIEFPNYTPQMMSIIQLALKQAEELSNIPLISQGQQGERAPQTFGEAEMQNNNGHTLLRSIGERIDDFITAPFVDGMYEMLLLDPNVPEDEKGDFQMDCAGTSAMVEKAIQEQTAMIGVQMSANPIYEINPAKAFAEWWKTKRMDPTRIQLTDEEKAQKAQQPPPEAPQVQVAKVNAQARIETTKMTASATLKRAEMDTDRDTQFQQALNERAEIAASANAQELELRRELEVYKENNLMKRELDKLKAMLATKSAELDTQKELSAAALSAGREARKPSQVMKPPSEPAGRAVDGQAYAQ